MLPSCAFPGKQGSQSWVQHQFALVPAAGGSWPHLVLGFFQRDEVPWLFSLGVAALFCKPRVEDGTGSCLALAGRAVFPCMGESKLQICPEPRALTLPVSGLGNGRCTYPWPGKDCTYCASPGAAICQPWPNW